MDAEQINTIIKEIKVIQERLNAIEREQKLIMKDIISGSPEESMKKRLLQKKKFNPEEYKKKIDDEIKIEI